MARGQKEGTLYVLDVSSDSEFFERAKDCVSRSIQRLIFTNPKDEVGLIIAGADTKNHLNDQFEDSYKNLMEAIDLTIPTWNHIRFLDKEVQACDETVDWLDAIILALDYAKTVSESRKFTRLEIVLLTPKCGQVPALDQLDKVIESFTEQGVGCKAVVIDKNSVVADFQRLISESNGSLETIADYEADVRFIGPKKVRPTPWNQGLTIGTQITINCAAYVKIADPKMVPSFKIKSATTDEPVQRNKRFFKNFKEIDPDKEMDNMMNGFMYGGSAIPNYNFMSVNFGENCSQFALFGFVKHSSILSEYLIGDGCHVVVPQSKYPVSVRKFNALVRVLIDTDNVLLVRKMYNKSCNPKFNVLFPGYMEEGNTESQPILTMIETLFKEDLIELKLPKLQETAVTEAQRMAVGKLIDDMKISDEILAEYLVDPVPQHLVRCITKRALKCKEPLTVIDDDIKKLLEVPDVLGEDTMRTIKELFPLENVKKQTKLEILVQKMAQAGLAQENGEEEEEVSTEQVQNFDADLVEVGTITPADDYDFLLKRGESFKTVSDQLEEVLKHLVFKTVKIQEKKVATAMLMYREHSKTFGSYRYNDWIEQFKNELLMNAREEFFTKIVVQYELGLITEEESENSTRKLAEATEFYALSKPVAMSNVDMSNVSSVFQDYDDIDDLLE